jgi:EARLY FLOWERING 3 protein
MLSCELQNCGLQVTKYELSITDPWLEMPLQGVSYDGRYSYVTCYLNPMSPSRAYLPYMNVGHHGVPDHVSLNGTSRSTVVDEDTELQCVPLVAESSVPTPGPKSSKKGKFDDDLAVPTYSTGTQGSSQRISASSTPKVQQAASRDQSWPRKKWDSGKAKRFNTEAPRSSNQLQLHQTEKNSDEQTGGFSEQTGGLNEQNGGMSEVTGCLSEQNAGLSWHTGSVTASVDDRDVRDRDIDQQDADIDVNVLECNLRERDRDAAKQLQPSLASPDGRVQESEGLRGQSEHYHDSCETSENVSEVSEQLGQSCCGDESESSMLDYVPVENITPLDVMSGIGEQEFWRARKAILRQQKMFSVQVYELHRLMEVQKQIAMCPDLTLEGDKEEMEEQEQEQEDQQPVPEPVSVTPLPPQVPELPAKYIDDDGIKQWDNNQPVIKEAPQLMYPVPVPHQQGFLPGQPWQATPYAANEWAPQIGPSYMYLPYPPPYTPAYGYHPMIHPEMVMYEQSGGMQHARMPPWQHPVFPHSSRVLGPGAAWYNAPHVPVMESAQQGVPVGPSKYRHPPGQGESLGASEKMHVSIPNSKQGGGQSCKVGQGQSHGWVKGRRMYPVELHRKDSAQGEQQEHEQLQEQDKLGGIRHVEGPHEKTLKRAHDSTISDPSPNFPQLPVPNRNMPQGGVIKAVPRAISATPESTADILLSIQQGRQQQ